MFLSIREYFRAGLYEANRRRVKGGSVKRDAGASESIAVHHVLRYSYRRASMGFNRAAFIAGHRPNTSPMLIETLRPTIGAHMGT